MTLKGFNEFGEWAMGIITFTFNIDGLTIKEKFYIVNADTSLNFLLRWLWIHENQIVPSSLH